MVFVATRRAWMAGQSAPTRRGTRKPESSRSRLPYMVVKLNIYVDSVIIFCIFVRRVIVFCIRCYNKKVRGCCPTEKSVIL